MSFIDIQFIFNRALGWSFGKKKMCVVFTILSLCSLLEVFFRALSVNVGSWLGMSLVFFPLFICIGILLSAGIFLIRLYHDEIKSKNIPYRDVFIKSWEIILGGSYFSIPLILAYLLLWMILGFFMLLRELPGIGDFFGVVLAFGPFLMNLGALLLVILGVVILFFVTPIVALNGYSRTRTIEMVAERVRSDPFSNLMLGLIAIAPIFLVSILLAIAWLLTTVICFTCSTPEHTVLQSFFMMIPCAAILSPPLLFFFNFAAESHIFLQKQNIK